MEAGPGVVPRCTDSRSDPDAPRRIWSHISAYKRKYSWRYEVYQSVPKCLRTLAQRQCSLPRVRGSLRDHNLSLFVSLIFNMQIILAEHHITLFEYFHQLNLIFLSTCFYQLL